MHVEQAIVDLSGLKAEAKPIVGPVAEVYLKHTAPWFIGLIVHGSAVKGGIIPGCEAIRRLPSGSALQKEIEAFYQAAWTYYPTEDSLEHALSVIEHGVAFLQAAGSWWHWFQSEVGSEETSWEVRHAGDVVVPCS